MTDTETTDLNRVLVLGGQGVLGPVIADAFAAAGWTTLRGGRRPVPGADFRHVDLDEPETVEKALAEVDLIVSTVPDERLVAERLAGARPRRPAHQRLGPARQRRGPAARAPSRSPTGSRSGAAAPCWPRGRSAAEATTWPRPPAPCCSPGRWPRDKSRPAGVVVPEEIAAIRELRPALAAAGIVVVDEPPPAAESGEPERVS
jgi:hypothetical protein